MSCRITLRKIVASIRSGSLASASSVWTRETWWWPITCRDAGRRSITASSNRTTAAAVPNSSLPPTSRWTISICLNLFVRRPTDAAQAFVNTPKGWYFLFDFSCPIFCCSLSDLVSWSWSNDWWNAAQLSNYRVGLLPAVLDQNRYGNALKAHLRDSVRTNRPLRHHLSRETLPSLDNYQAHSVANRATLEELRLGADHQQGIQKVLQFSAILHFFYERKNHWIRIAHSAIPFQNMDNSEKKAIYLIILNWESGGRKSLRVIRTILSFTNSERGQVHVGH